MKVRNFLPISNQANLDPLLEESCCNHCISKPRLPKWKQMTQLTILRASQHNLVFYKPNSSLSSLFKPPLHLYCSSFSAVTPTGLFPSLSFSPLMRPHKWPPPDLFHLNFKKKQLCIIMHTPVVFPYQVCSTTWLGQCRRHMWPRVQSGLGKDLRTLNTG